MRWAIRRASPAGVRARCRSSRICSFRLEKTLSITRRVEASARSRPRLLAVRLLSGVSSVVPVGCVYSVPGRFRGFEP